MIANRVASFGSKAPELTEDARKLLGIKKGEPVEVDEISE